MKKRREEEIKKGRGEEVKKQRLRGVEKKRSTDHSCKSAEDTFSRSSRNRSVPSLMSLSLRTYVFFRFDLWLTFMLSLKPLL